MNESKKALEELIKQQIAMIKTSPTSYKEACTLNELVSAYKKFDQVEAVDYQIKIADGIHKRVEI